MELVADIGATNARFQYADQGELIGNAVVLGTADYAEGKVLLTTALARLNDAHEMTEPVFERAIVAVAGPTERPGQIIVTNTGLLIDADVYGGVLDCQTHLANDFFAMAHGVPYFKQLTQLGGDQPSNDVKALLGPGTGLGMATLIPASIKAAGSNAPMWRVIPSEGGHADLAPGSHLEAELWAVLLENHGHVSWETVLSGTGLQNLYRAMLSIWGGVAADLTPAEIVEQGKSMAAPVCHQTLETFCGLLGAAAGNLALTVTARGGVYIGGGIVPRIIDFVVTSPLRRRFEERGEMTDMIAKIPLMLITDTDPGLAGALRCLHSL